MFCQCWTRAFWKLSTWFSFTVWALCTPQRGERRHGCSTEPLTLGWHKTMARPWFNHRAVQVPGAAQKPESFPPRICKEAVLTSCHCSVCSTYSAIPESHRSSPKQHNSSVKHGTPNERPRLSKRHWCNNLMEKMQSNNRTCKTKEITYIISRLNEDDSEWCKKTTELPPGINTFHSTDSLFPGTARK